MRRRQSMSLLLAINSPGEPRVVTVELEYGPRPLGPKEIDGLHVRIAKYQNSMFKRFNKIISPVNMVNRTQSFMIYL